MLKRWLECRGKPTGGRREELLERVALLKALPNSHILDVKVDKGYWYERKCETLRAQQVHQIVNSQALPSTQVHQYPTEGWKPFPSVDMPVMFNYGHIYFYLVESIPSLPQSDESDEDCEDIPESSRIQDPFDDEHKSLQDVKTLRKGLRFFKSKYVRNVHDVCEAGRTYFVKAEVRASMEAVKHDVQIAISVRSGNVQGGTCDCIQQSLGRCVHVCATLLFIWSHIRLNGYGGKQFKCVLYCCVSLVYLWYIMYQYTIFT